jgi:hypothetical protein
VTAKTKAPPEPVSLPLYISGLIVTICGIAAVNSVLGNDRFTSATMLLAALGFIFSVTCRWMQIDKRVINGIPLVLAGYMAIRYLRHTIDATSFIPIEALQSDMMIAVLLVWLSVIRAWTLTSDGAVVFTSVTSVAMIGLVGAFNVNADLIMYFVIYVMASLYMVMHQNYLIHRTWLPSQKSASDSTILKTHLVLCVAMGFVAMVAGTALVVPVRMIGAGLSLGQAMKQFFAPGNANDTAKAQIIDFSDDPNFNIGTGDGYTADDTVVMVATPSDRQEHYWRGRTYDHYTRHGWTSTLGSPSYAVPPTLIDVEGNPQASYRLRRFAEVEGPELPAPKPGKKGTSPAKLPELRTRFDVMLGRTSTVYSPQGTFEIQLPPRQQTELEQTPDGYVGYDALQQKFAYLTISNPILQSPTLLATVKSPKYPADIKHRYIDDRGQDVLTDSERVKIGETALNIVNSLPPDQRTEFNKAEAIRQWVSANCVYSLKVDPIPQDADAVNYFLFTSHKGYCDLFSSSMALLCRYAGLPARVATGFAPGSLNQKQAYDIRARDKHAWVEVYFPNYGWVTFDPTGGAVSETKKADSKASFEGLRQLYYSLMNFLNLNGPMPVILFTTVLVCLTYVIKIEVVDRMREQMRLNSKQAMIQKSGELGAADAEVIASAKHITQDRYRRMCQALVMMGLPSRASRTPAAYAQLAHRVLPSRYRAEATVPIANVLAAVDALTEDITIAAYAPDADVTVLVSKERDTRGADAISEVERARSAHWWKAFGIALRPATPKARSAA